MYQIYPQPAEVMRQNCLYDIQGLVQNETMELLFPYYQDFQDNNNLALKKAQYTSECGACETAQVSCVKLTVELGSKTSSL